MSYVRSVAVALIALSAMIAVSVSVPAQSGAQQEQTLIADMGKWYELLRTRGEFQVQVYYSEGKPAIQVVNMRERKTVYADWLILDRQFAFVTTLSTRERITYTCTAKSISTASATLNLNLFPAAPTREETVTVEVDKWAGLPWAGEGFVFKVQHRADGKTLVAVWDESKRAYIHVDYIARDATAAFVVGLPSGEMLVYNYTPTHMSPTSVTILFGLVSGAPQAQESEAGVNVHFWISNQSLGPGVPGEVRMVVSIWKDGTKIEIFNKVMAVLDQHNVAFVDRSLPTGAHKITVEVGDPYRLSMDATVEVANEVWIFIRFWYDPESVYEGQRAPKITVDVFDRPPGVK